MNAAAAAGHLKRRPASAGGVTRRVYAQQGIAAVQPASTRAGLARSLRAKADELCRVRPTLLL